MQIKDIINIDPEILSGQPVFTGTREQAVSLLDMASKLLTSKNVESIYEAVA
jgi:uncharacterized protein (DUF433 family)